MPSPQQNTQDFLCFFQGTTKPTKYIKIRDDLRLSMTDLQNFCNYACYQCVRTRSPISIPTAIRYADLCAYR